MTTILTLAIATALIGGWVAYQRYQNGKCAVSGTRTHTCGVDVYAGRGYKTTHWNCEKVDYER